MLACPAPLTPQLRAPPAHTRSLAHPRAVRLNGSTRDSAQPPVYLTGSTPHSLLKMEGKERVSPTAQGQQTSGRSRIRQAQGATAQLRRQQSTARGHTTIDSPSADFGESAASSVLITLRPAGPPGLDPDRKVW